MASVATALLVAETASAQDKVSNTGDIGVRAKGTLIVSADRMFGFTSWSARAEQDVPAVGTVVNKSSYTQFGLLWGGGVSGTVNPFAAPRISVDYTVIDGLTIGGSLGFLSDGTKTSGESRGVTSEKDGPTTSGFVFAPRVGYILGFGQNFGLWLRGGITYWTYSSSTDNANGAGVITTDKVSVNGFALNLEPTFVISPVDHFGFYVGGVLDLPLSGKFKDERITPGRTDSTETTYKILNLGLTTGLMGWL